MAASSSSNPFADLPAAGANPFVDDPPTEYAFARADPRRLSMGLDLHGTGRVTQMMQGPLGVDVDNDGTVDVVITPEKLMAFALRRGTAVTPAGRQALAAQPGAAAASAAPAAPCTLPISSVVVAPPRYVTSHSPLPAPAPVQAAALQSTYQLASVVPRQLVAETAIRLPAAPAAPVAAPTVSSVSVAPPVYVVRSTPATPSASPRIVRPADPAPPRYVATTVPLVPQQPLAAPLPRWLQWQAPPPRERLAFLRRPTGHEPVLMDGITESVVQVMVVPDFGPKVFAYHEPLGDARAGFVKWSNGWSAGEGPLDDDGED